MFYKTWVRDTDTAKINSATKNLVAGLEDSQIRPTLFAKIKQNYLRAAEMIGNLHRIVSVSETITMQLERSASRILFAQTHY